MHNGLYLGGVQLPYLSSLRVYLPREAYSAEQFEHLAALIDVDQNPISIDAQELADSLGRVSRSTSNPMPTPDMDKVRILRMSEDAVPLYAPNQMVTRSIVAGAELLSGPLQQLSKLLAGEEEWSTYLGRAESTAHVQMPVQTRSSTWGIPFSWFVLIYANDRMEVVEANGRVLTVRVQVPLPIAVGRAERTLAMLAAMAPDLDLFEELNELQSWLEGFNEDGVLELDYGPLAERVHPDDSPADIHGGLASLAEGDLGAAAAAYRRLANRWVPIRQLARAN